MELQAFYFIAWLFAQGYGVSNAKRADRGNPADAQAGGGAQALRAAQAVVVLEHIARIDKAIQAQRAVIAGARKRRDHLGIERELLGRADGQGTGTVARTQRACWKPRTEPRPPE